MEYWTNVKIGSSQQARTENEIAAREGLPATQDDSLWVWKSNEEMQAELLHLFGRNKIIDNLDWLVKTNYLETRANPKYQWDRTKQYRMAVQMVQDAVWKWYTSLNDASFNFKRSNVENKTIKPPRNKRTIPETTTQDTTESDSRGDAPHGVESSDKPAVKPVKARKPDPLFDAVAKHIFGISDTAGLSDAGSTVGAIKSVVKRLCAARAPQWTVEEQCAAVEGYVKQCTKQNPVQKWKAGFEPAFLKYLETKLTLAQRPPQTVTPPAAVDMSRRDDSFNIQRAIAAVKMFHASDKPSQRELLETNTRFLTERGYQVLEGGVVIAPETAPQTA
jgi:hypothetical protein